MRKTDNPELKRTILKHLVDLYKITEVRESNHLSSYVYCRTRCFLDQKQTADPTDQEVLLFSIGYGLQDVLTPKSMDAPVYEKHGIIYRPDMSFTPVAADIERLVELKTTRKSAKYHYIEGNIPETWLMYMMGGCYLRGTTEYDLIILYLMGNYSPPFPEIYTDTFSFEKQEIEDNWQTIMDNKMVADKALETGVPPEPFQHCLSWECKYCRYKLVCDVLADVKEDRGIEEAKKLWD